MNVLRGLRVLYDGQGILVMCQCWQRRQFGTAVFRPPLEAPPFEHEPEFSAAAGWKRDKASSPSSAAHHMFSTLLPYTFGLPCARGERRRTRSPVGAAGLLGLSLRSIRNDTDWGKALLRLQRRKRVMS